MKSVLESTELNLQYSPTYTVHLKKNLDSKHKLANNNDNKTLLYYLKLPQLLFLSLVGL